MAQFVENPLDLAALFGYLNAGMGAAAAIEATRYLEARAQGRASEATARLAALQPREARLLTRAFSAKATRATWARRFREASWPCSA